MLRLLATVNQSQLVVSSQRSVGTVQRRHALSRAVRRVEPRARSTVAGLDPDRQALQVVNRGRDDDKEDEEDLVAIIAEEEKEEDE